MSAPSERAAALASLEREPGEHAAIVTFRCRSPNAVGLALAAAGEVRLPAGAWTLVGLAASDARSWCNEPELPLPSTLPRARGARRLPSMQGQLLFQVGAERGDMLVAALRQLDAALLPICWKDEEVVGGWGSERREPFGFRERARWTSERAEAVTIQRGAGTGGTWLLYLRFETDRARFLAHRDRDQLAIMGAEHSGSHLSKPRADAHVARVHAYGSRMLRRGFPYRISGTEGLAFVAVARSSEVFDDALDAMLGVDGPADRMLDYAAAVSGGAYFVPPQLPRVSLR